MSELIELFSLEKVSKSGARFDPEKAKWFNAQYLHRKSNAELAALFMPVLAEKGHADVPVEKVERIMGLVKERATFITDLWNLSCYFFEAPESYDPKAVAKFWKDDNPEHVMNLRHQLEVVEDFTAPALEAKAHAWIEAEGLPMGKVMNTLRLAVVGASTGANMFEIAEVIGRAEFVRRIERAHEVLG